MNRLLAVVVFILSFTTSMIAQDLSQSVDVSGVTIYYPSTFTIRSWKYGEIMERIVFAKITDDEVSSAIFTILHANGQSSKSQDELIAIMADSANEAAISLEYEDARMGNVEVGKYGKMSASKIIYGTVEGISMVGECIELSHNSTEVSITLQSTGATGLEEMRAMVNAMKCP